MESEATGTARAEGQATVERWLERYVARDFDALLGLVVDEPEERALIENLAKGLPADFKVLGARVRAVVTRSEDRAEALQEIRLEGDGESHALVGWIDLERGDDGEWRLRPSTIRRA